MLNHGITAFCRLIYSEKRLARQEILRFPHPHPRPRQPRGHQARSSIKRAPAKKALRHGNSGGEPISSMYPSSWVQFENHCRPFCFRPFLASQICLGYACHLPGVCQACAGHMPGICQAYAQHMPCTCPANAWHMPGICPAYARHIPGICLAYA